MYVNITYTIKMHELSYKFTTNLFKLLIYKQRILVKTQKYIFY